MRRRGLRLRSIGFSQSTSGDDWLEDHDNPTRWEKVEDIPDRVTLWVVHTQLKRQLFQFMRERARRGWMAEGRGPMHVLTAGTLLSPDALTIGFARRFATYKRALLIFHDMERLKLFCTTNGSRCRLSLRGRHIRRMLLGET